MQFLHIFDFHHAAHPDQKAPSGAGAKRGAMAHGLNMSQSAYSRLELGHTRMDLDRLMDIARMLQVQAWELLVPEQAGPYANGLMGAVIAQASGHVPEDVLLRLVRLHAAHLAEDRQVHERHARAAQRILNLLQR